MGGVCFKAETPIKIFTDPSLDLKEVIYRFKVYVITCVDNHYFVGVTENVDEEMKKHMSGSVPWTNLHKPLSIHVHKSFDECYDARVEETSKTLKLMSIKGVDKVRGGRYSNFILNKFQTTSLKNELAHNESLCFNCNEKGHYSKSCPLSLQYL